MYKLFADFAAFTSAVGNHLLTLLAGCVVTVVIGIIEKHFRKKLSWRQDLAVFALFLFFACFQAWRDKSGELGAEKQRHASDSQQAHTDNEKLQGNFDDLKYECRFKDGQLSALSQQNQDQQTSINNCQNQALQLLKPPEARVITRATRLNTIFDSTKPVDTTVIMVASVTRDYPSFKGNIECETPFDVREGLLAQGALGVSLPPTNGPEKRVPITFLGSTWRTGDTVFALVHGNNLDPTHCFIRSE